MKKNHREFIELRKGIYLTWILGKKEFSEKAIFERGRVLQAEEITRRTWGRREQGSHRSEGLVRGGNWKCGWELEQALPRLLGIYSYTTESLKGFLIQGSPLFQCIGSFIMSILQTRKLSNLAKFVISYVTLQSQPSGTWLYISFSLIFLSASKGPAVGYLVVSTGSCP